MKNLQTIKKLKNIYLKIIGWDKNSLLDVLFNISFSIWLEGCNFKCPFCFNTHCLYPIKSHYISVLDLYKEIIHYKDFIDYVHITGGEPSLQYKNLISLIKLLNKRKIKVSLNTNLYNYKYIYLILKYSRLDHLAADIKAPLNSKKIYLLTGKRDLNINNFVKSLKMIKNKVSFIELRTTVIPSILNKEDILNIVNFLIKIFQNKKFYYVLQQYIPSNTILDPSFKKIPSTSESYLEDIANYILQNTNLSEIYIRTRTRIFKIK